jgi:hypothetical protein
MTALQIEQLDNMNAASQRAGGLGSRLDELEYGDIPTPDVGSLSTLTVLQYRTAPALQTATYVHANILLIETDTQVITTAITNPDVPRIVTVKGNGANVTGNVVIAGTNINDEAITDTIASNGATEVVGVKAFKTVTSITVPPFAVAGTEAISIGVGVKIGFPVAITNTALVVAKNFDGSVDAGTVTAAATVEGSIYAVAGTLNGVKFVDLFFLG